MSFASSVFIFLKRNFGKYVPESLKALLRPYIFNLIYPTRKNVYKSACAAGKINRLVFKREAKPLVSIIIPAYNQLENTLCCLYSIIENTKNVKYEVILADDNSSDGTMKISGRVKNLKIVRNSSNLGFLRNCNKAAKKARGKYILFLNNDTYVQENWLSAMVSLAEKDRGIGIVGSKLVFKDGRLQEAGGIVWKDASAWNFGKFMDPELPEFNYVKETDYVSGASMLIRKELWNKTGGFDTRYAPAYFEDTDLAFEARKRGYKVVYQPASVVVHFEGASHGRDASKGIKKYQEINRKKFVKKWKTVLNKEHFCNGRDVFTARDRSKNKKTIVFIDYMVPQYDRDCGSRMMSQHMEFFTARGFNVKLIPDNFNPAQPYTSFFEQLGIEVLHGPYYSAYWKKWFIENKKRIDFVFLSRPNIAAKYLDFVLQEVGAVTLYQGHDLHYIREDRRYQVEKSGDAKRKAGYWKKIESAILAKVSTAYYPSLTEVLQVKKDIPGANVKLIPLHVYHEPYPRKYVSNKRRDMLFVGGFSHQPNVDGIMWFCREIMPLVRAKARGVKIHVVGSNTPPEIQALAGPDVIIEGYKTDEELERLYEKCRLVVAPLRYGAGLKGKIIEAMYRGLPVVTTSVGAEGIDAGALFIADEPAAFAGQVIKNYHSKELNAAGKRAAGYIARHFSEKALADALKEVL